LRTRAHLLILLAIVAAALALRADPGAESFWTDELASLSFSSGRARLEWVPPTGVVVQPASSLTSLEGAAPWWSIWWALSEDTHPPLYFILLRFWRELFGEGEVAARSLSVVASLAALLLLFDTMRLLHGPSAALWACLLMALAAPQVRYSLEARTYMLLLAFALAACCALVRIERLGYSPRRAAALGTCLLACVFIHYHGFAALLSLGAYAVVRLRGKARRSSLLSLTTVVLLFGAAWGPVLRSQSASSELALMRAGGPARPGTPSGQWLREPAVGHVERTLLRSGALPLLHLTAPLPQVRRFPPWPVLGYVAACVLALRRRDLVLWCIWYAVSVGMIVVTDLALSLAQLSWIRYTLIASPAVFALLTASVAQAPRLLRHGLPACAAIACVLAVPGAYQTTKAPWREIGAALRLAARPGEAVILDARDRRVLWDGRGLLHYAYSPDRPLLLADGPPAPSARRRLQGAGTAWLAAELDFDLENRLPGAVVEDSLHWPGGPPLRRLSFPPPSSCD
jgi:hypothetical protein